MPPKRIVIIGSGFGGLSAAIRLAAAGHSVTVLEKRDKPGGRAYVYEKDGFTFDGGPTIITAPFMFDDLFALAGKKREDYVTFTPCDPFYRIFDHEGRPFNYNADEMFTLDQIDKRNPTDKRGYLNFLHTTKAIFQKGFVELADKPFLTPFDMMKVAPDLIKLGSYRSVYNYVSQFIKDDFLRQVFSFHPLLVGGNPFDTTSIYALIHYLEREWGVHYAMGGTGALVRALVQLFQELGGTLHLNTEVETITFEGRKATGVVIKGGERLTADVVVSNADAANTYLRHVPREHRKFNTDERITGRKYSMSLFVWYFGTKRQYRDGRLAHHNIILGQRYKGLLDDIFNKKTMPEDFSLYLHMPSLTDPSMAPDGGECFYVLSPVAHLGGGANWARLAPLYRERILTFLEENYLPGLRENLVAEHFIDPRHFQGELNSYLGSAFSVQPILAQSAYFRPHNRSEDAENLYLVGAGTHPGAGLPGVLSSGKIAADLIGSA